MKTKPAPTAPQKNYRKNYRLSLRTSPTSVTSITLNSKLISLWMLIILLTSSSTKKIDENFIKFSNEDLTKKFITDFVYKNLKHWKGSTGKGLSSFISSCIFSDICNHLCEHLNFDKEDAKRFFDSVVDMIDTGDTENTGDTDK